jgi:voltage-gated potassium channel Kch
VRRFGHKVCFGDASRLDLLTAAKTNRECSFVLAIGDVEASPCTAETVRRHFPHVKLFARARNRFPACRLMNLGAELIERETLLDSVELAQHVLPALGIQAWEAAQTVARFKAHDERTLERQHAVYHDRTQLIQT